ncbi:CD225/dispanin family protein [Leifsonia aquatica]|uniref:CD225/dispanin family protein n=1 Tax=Leifsonia aquatica TaxID=144185 RepID=UPI000469D48E|nr:CD225/dispanin family protein [Leifsonia aquatica]
MTTEPTAPQTRRSAEAAPARTPSTHLVFAIVSTVLFWPVGLFAILKSVATRKAIEAHDLPAAAAASRTAKTLSIVATCVGVAGWALSVLLVVLTLGLAGSTVAEDPYKGPGVATYDLQAGDCFTAPTSSMTPGVPPIDCAQPHTGEVYNTAELKGRDYPGKSAIVEAAVENCVGAPLTDYVGAEAAGTYTEHYLAPSEEFWSAGKRTLVCFLTPGDDSELTGSVRAAK